MNSLVVMVSLLAFLPGSGKNYPMTPATSVPGAAGSVKVQKDKENGNTKMDIKVDHLANPSSLTPPKNAYLAWVRAGSDVASNESVKQGVIKVDKNLKGELKVVTPSKDFDIFITAEQNESVSAPSDFVVLKAHINPN